jgi:GT2 family glycosyltransferase
MGRVSFLEVSVIVPTRDRPKDLAELLTTILNQDSLPLEVIIVDDSYTCSARCVVDSFVSKFDFVGYKLKYVNGRRDGLPAARNLGVNCSNSDILIFCDDDILLDSNVLNALVTFLRENPFAKGVQPAIISPKELIDDLNKKLENAFNRTLMLNYRDDNKLMVRKSGASVLPYNLTEVIDAQRLSGCCCGYKREVFGQFSFDTKLKRWAFMEDLDFSYRIYKKNQSALYAIPHAKVVHKVSNDARLRAKDDIFMKTVYSFYVFFKDIYDGSISKLLAFLLGLVGNSVWYLVTLVIKAKPKKEWWRLIYLLESYSLAIRNLRSILAGKLDFFNKSLIM